MLSLIALLAFLVWPLLFGVALPFFERADPRRRAIWFLALAPWMLCSIAAVVFGAWRDPLVVFVILVLLIFVYLPIQVGRVLGRNFAGVRKGRQAQDIRNTFD